MERLALKMFWVVLVFGCLLHLVESVSDLVSDVPRYGKPPTTMFAGQIDYNTTYHKKLFYWFAECEQGHLAGVTPLVLWLNGGPGASSMTGFLTENIGPLTLQLNGSLTRNYHAWTSFGHVIAFDNPVGAGFSSTRSGGYVTSQKQMAQELHHALLTFLTIHPEYRQNPLWVSGESYAGHYVPHFAWEVHLQNQINLAGIVLGNAMLRCELQYPAIAEFAYANGLVDKAGKEEAAGRLERCRSLIVSHRNLEAFKECEATVAWLYQVKAGGVFQYDIAVEDPHAFDSLTSVLSDFLNDPATHAALHVGDSIWSQADETGPVADGLALDFVSPSDYLVENLLGAGYRAVLYNGIRDGSACGHLGMIEAVTNMKWVGAEQFRRTSQEPWYCNGGLLCGYNRTAGLLTYVTYVRTGHLVPTTVPVAAVDMWKRLLTMPNADIVSTNLEHTEEPHVLAPLVATIALVAALVSWVTMQRQKARQNPQQVVLLA